MSLALVTPLPPAQPPRLPARLPMDDTDPGTLAIELRRLQQQVNTLRARLDRLEGGTASPVAPAQGSPASTELRDLGEVVKHLHHYVSHDMKREVAEFVDALVMVHLQAGCHADGPRSRP